MEKFEGKAIFKGVAIGRIMFYGKKENIVKRFKIEDTAAEIQRYDNARKESIEQLKKLHDDAVKKVGEENAAIFEVHAMLLEDDDFNDSVHNMIENEEVNAEYPKCLRKWRMNTSRHVLPI